MKFSSNTVGMLIFAALATTVFVFMALRPAVEGNAMNFGIPLNAEKTSAITETASEDAAAIAEIKEITESVTETSSEAVMADTPASVPGTNEEAKQNSDESDEGIEPDTEEKPATN